MIFKRKNDSVEIIFEDTDLIEERVVIEQGFVMLKNLIQLHYAHKRKK